MFCKALGFETLCPPGCRLCEKPTPTSLHADVEVAPEGRLKACQCGQSFSPRSNRHRFCDACGIKNERAQNAKYQATYRRGHKKGRV